jgi:GntR family transcriptional regulator, transcriptional repressor for pyruvate dehydrogenase complex
MASLRGCPNPILSFMGRFMNDVLQVLLVMRGDSTVRQEELRDINRHHHVQLIDLLRRGDSEEVRGAMLEHMLDAERYLVELDAHL